MPIRSQYDVFVDAQTAIQRLFGPLRSLQEMQERLAEAAKSYERLKFQRPNWAAMEKCRKDAERWSSAMDAIARSRERLADARPLIKDFSVKRAAFLDRPTGEIRPLVPVSQGPLKFAAAEPENLSALGAVKRQQISDALTAEQNRIDASTHKVVLLIKRLVGAVEVRIDQIISDGEYLRFDVNSDLKWTSLWKDVVFEISVVPVRAPVSLGFLR